jgi:hypothetical protein
MAWLSPLAEAPGKVNENHAASWFSVRIPMSSGAAFARGSDAKRRRMDSSAITSEKG